MFANLKGIFSPTNKDLRKRILFTLACLAIFALGTNIIVPGAKEITKNLGFLELLNLMSGGSLKSFSIFALGVMPYITATIITQFFEMDLIPYFKELKEQGATGRQKLNKINRYLGIIFALVQGYIFSIAFLGGDALTVKKLKKGKNEQFLRLASCLSDPNLKPDNEDEKTQTKTQTRRTRTRKK